MVDRLGFFKPRRSNLLQIGQIRHQSTPLYLYIQNINLVCHSDLLWAELGRENGVYTPPNAKGLVDRLGFFKPRRSNLLQIGQIRHQSTPLYLYIQNMNLVCHSDLLWTELGRENGVYTPPNAKALVDRLGFFKPRRPKLLQIGQIRHQSTPLHLYIQNINLVCHSDLLWAELGRENGVYTPPNAKAMVDRLSFFKPRRPNLLQIGQIGHQSTPLYLHIQNINLVCHSDLLWDELGRENGVYTPPNAKGLVDRLGFFKPKRSNLLQIGQIRHQSTPLYLYIQNINLVCHSNLLWTELGRENGVYTPPNTKAMVDRLSFFKPRRPNLLQIGQIGHQSTPLYLHIQNINLVCHSDLLWDELGRENGVYTPPNTKAMVDRLSFFKPRRPNLLQIGQIGHQSTPLYLHIQNINLVCHSDLLWDELGRENGVYTPPNTKAMVDRLSFFKPRRPKLLQIGQIGHQSTSHYLYIQNINLVCHSDLLWAELGRENGVYTPLNTKALVDRLSFFKPRRHKLLQIGQIGHQSTPHNLYIQNINLVCHSDLLWTELGRENGVYTPPNAKALVDRLGFFKPRRPKLLQIGQIRHQSTPLHLYIQNIKLVCHSDLLWNELGWENGVYTPPNTKAMVDRLSFFKPRRPKLLQIGQIGHQSTPLYLHIQNINLVCHSDLLWTELGRENGVYTPPNTKAMVDRLSFFKPRRPNLLQIEQIWHQSTPLYLYIQISTWFVILIYFGLN